VFDNGVQEFLGATNFLFGLLGLGDVDETREPGRTALEGENAGIDADMYLRAISFQVSPDCWRAHRRLEGENRSAHLLPILLRSYVEHRHREKLFARIAVMFDTSVIDCEELEAVAIEHPHWKRVALEQHAKRHLAAFEICNIDANADTAPVCSPPFLDADPAVAAEALFVAAFCLGMLR